MSPLAEFIRDFPMVSILTQIISNWMIVSHKHRNKYFSMLFALVSVSSTESGSCFWAHSCHRRHSLERWLSIQVQLGILAYWFNFKYGAISINLISKKGSHHATISSPRRLSDDPVFREGLRHLIPHASDDVSLADQRDEDAEALQIERKD